MKKCFSNSEQCFFLSLSSCDQFSKSEDFVGKIKSEDKLLHVMLMSDAESLDNLDEIKQPREDSLEDLLDEIKQPQSDLSSESSLFGEKTDCATFLKNGNT